MRQLLFVGLLLCVATPVRALTITEDMVSSDLSSFSIAPSSVSADGVQKATASVTVKNFSGVPLANKPVHVFNALSAGPVSIYPQSAVTDQDGRAQFMLSSAKPGEAVIRASLDGSILEGRIQFVPASSCEFASYALVKAYGDPAVYFYGKDCKRHAFPDEKTYFGWFSDFNAVVSLSPAEIAGMPLGKNVTHKPGRLMVKFPSIDKVYAVSQGGVLHWVTSEALAEALYGPQGINDYPAGVPWNKKVVDVSEAFYNDYVIGPDIRMVVDNIRTDYSPITQLSNVKTIDDNWR